MTATWVGRHDRRAPAHLIDWQGKDWTPEIAAATGAKAAHPNARFTVAATNNPALDSEWDNPAGVAIDAFIFGGRRSTTVPLVTEARDWGKASTWRPPWATETTAAAAGQGDSAPRPVRDAAVRRLQHGRIFRPLARFERPVAARAKLPKIFTVNWFRKDADGQIVVAGLRRQHARDGLDAGARRRSRAGRRARVRHHAALQRFHWHGLDFSEAQYQSVTSIDTVPGRRK